MELEKEKSTYGPFERFMYLIFIPIIFTVILITVLLSMFGYDVMDPLLRAANKVPGLSNVVPDPKAEPDPTLTEQAPGTSSVTAEEVVALKAKISALNQELLTAKSDVTAKTAELESMQAKLDVLTAELEEKTLSDEEYLARIRSLAKVYTGMSPSKAAPVLEQLTLAERVLVLNQMKSSAQVDILEKMNPVIAAETSILLKDVEPVKDQQIAALQSRLDLLEQEGSSETKSLTSDELSLTIATMNPGSAAEVLLEMMKANSNKVIQILQGMDVAARSAIMNAISQEDAEVAATIAAKLDT